MATSFMDAQLPSDDEEDEDFEPDKKLASGGGGGGGKGGKGAKRGFMEVSDGEDGDADADGGGGGDDAAAAGVRDLVAAGLADAMDDARYCAAAGQDEHDARPAGDQRRSCTAMTTGHPVWADVPTPHNCGHPNCQAHTQRSREACREIFSSGYQVSDASQHRWHNLGPDSLVSCVTAPKKPKPSKKAQRVESEALAAVRTAKQSAKVDAIWAALKQGRAGQSADDASLHRASVSAPAAYTLPAHGGKTKHTEPSHVLYGWLANLASLSLHALGA